MEKFLEFLKSLLDTPSSLGTFALMFGADIFFVWNSFNEDPVMIVGRWEFHPACFQLLACVATSYLVFFFPILLWKPISSRFPSNKFKQLSPDADRLLHLVKEELGKSGQRGIGGELKSKLIAFESKLQKFKIPCPEYEIRDDLLDWYLVLPFLREFSKLGDLESARSCRGALEEGLL